MKEQHDYYQVTQGWAYDMYQSQRLWLRRSLLALSVITLLLGLSLVTNLFLLPLKEKVPYLYAFDHATGEVTQIGQLDKTTFNPSWELSRYLLMRYVINRESYDADNIDLPYQQVWAQSSDEVKKQYVNAVSDSNANSPIKRYGKDKYLTVRIIAINKLNDNTVDLKFEKQLHDRATVAEQVTPKEAIIRWEYGNADTSQKMLDRDPLGFKIIYYQVSQVNL